MKFTKGYWLNRPGVEAQTPSNPRGKNQKKSRLPVLRFPIRRMSALWADLCWKMFISSPKADIIRTQAYHFMGSAKRASIRNGGGGTIPGCDGDRGRAFCQERQNRAAHHQESLLLFPIIMKAKSSPR